MTHDELSIDLRTEEGGVLVFKLRGSLDLATTPTVRAALTEATDSGPHDIIVDLTQLEFLDSTGLGVLIGAHRRAAEHAGSFRLVDRRRPDRASPQHHRIDQRLRRLSIARRRAAKTRSRSGDALSFVKSFVDELDDVLDARTIARVA